MKKKKKKTVGSGHRTRSPFPNVNFPRATAGVRAKARRKRDAQGQKGRADGRRKPSTAAGKRARPPAEPRTSCAPALRPRAHTGRQAPPLRAPRPPGLPRGPRELPQRPELRGRARPGSPGSVEPEPTGRRQPGSQWGQRPTTMAALLPEPRRAPAPRNTGWAQGCCLHWGRSVPRTSRNQAPQPSRGRTSRGCRYPGGRAVTRLLRAARTHPALRGHRHPGAPLAGSEGRTAAGSCAQVPLHFP